MWKLRFRSLTELVRYRNRMLPPPTRYFGHAERDDLEARLVRAHRFSAPFLPSRVWR